MAASKWQVYKTAKKYMINGAIDLDGGAVRMCLVKATKSAVVTNFARSIKYSITHIASAGISQAVMTCSSPTIISINASTWGFDSVSVVFKATGSNLTSIKYAVIFISAASSAAAKLIAFCKLSDTAFQLSDGNTLTITPNASGYFTISGGVTA